MLLKQRVWSRLNRATTEYPLSNKKIIKSNRLSNVMKFKFYLILYLRIFQIAYTGLQVRQQICLRLFKHRIGYDKIIRSHTNPCHKVWERKKSKGNLLSCTLWQYFRFDHLVLSVLSGQKENIKFPFCLYKRKEKILNGNELTLLSVSCMTSSTGLSTRCILRYMEASENPCWLVLNANDHI